ncbi:hypothetical protein [Paraburkholderia fungorum]|jgi:hypothetical protein|uniref:YcgL domain-containing protein n=1 Tax=Paraburkholderia fungorum TaxID=134537 RepID=A0AAW3V3F6_9BURK|nr:hypothetical protein [Paraburkholderia fungorum]AJZ56027.1 hypothetical protein OI25_8107 [Paraburkholderia fungorum]MBB5545333.1 hypothetical protein [Paraburkholderia fungorum]MBB6205118.1 hypothetical protein [Paraburkholderia fungorum]MBU7440722.1 hypothetical protein [Paraburkholderia fungorum]MDE1011071.1 hypothetical protein [Paraburkholderia fungorum]
MIESTHTRQGQSGATDVQTPDIKPGLYYVSAVRSGGRQWWPLLGPFPDDHLAAILKVDAVRKLACELDPRGCWYAYGTVRIEHQENPPQGALNKRLL